MTEPAELFESRGFFTVDQVKLEYLRIGPGGSSDLTLVLLHEGLGCLALWKDFPQQLARRTGCSVLVYSRAGYGGSDPCPLPRPVSFMHDEALQVLPCVLDAARVSCALLIGHSDGASIALLAAGCGGDRRIEGLVLMAPHVFVEELTLHSIRAAAQAYAAGDLRRRLRLYHGSNVDGAFKGWSDVWLDAEFGSWNIEACLARIKIPVLCIQGKQDNYGTLRQLDKISAGLPRPPDILLLPDCGHSPFRDQPTATLEAIAPFVRRRKEYSNEI